MNACLFVEDAFVGMMPADNAALLIAKWQTPLQDTAFRNRFTTGDWEEGKKRSGAQPEEESQ